MLKKILKISVSDLKISNGKGPAEIYNLSTDIHILSTRLSIAIE